MVDVTTYESAEDVATKAPPIFATHKARYAQFVADGTLLMMGTFSDVQDHGSIGIFTTLEAAEAFVRGDPFVLEGVVRRWGNRESNEALVP